MEHDYDVAISFLRRDEPLALQVREALSPLRVFVYSKAQEQVAGREGVEAFREIFRNRSLISLVLFRPGWGQTPWTGVEETAIRDHCFERGWDHLMFVRLENQSEKPKWVPDSYLYLDFVSFGISDLVGAIKAKCARLGVALRPPTALERARRIAAEEKLKQETDQALRTSAQPLYDTAAVLFAAIEQRFAEIERETDWRILRDYEPQEFVAFMDQTSILLGCRWQPFPALVGGRVETRPKAEIRFQTISGRMPMPRERRLGYAISTSELEERHTSTFQLVRLVEHGWCWNDEAGSVLSTEALAEKIVDEFLSTRGVDISEPSEFE